MVRASVHGVYRPRVLTWAEPNHPHDRAHYKNLLQVLPEDERAVERKEHLVDASASLVPYDETSKAAQPHDRALADAATPTPLAQPILRGSALHGMPVSKTTTIPVSATQQQRFDNLPERFDDEFASYRRPHRSSAYAMHKGALRRLEPEGCSSPGMEINVCGA